jgi:hypothetical protein
VGIIFVALLADGLCAAPHMVERADDEGVFPLAQQRGDLEAEGSVTAAVGSGFLPVHEDAGFIVHRTEVQQHGAGKLFPRNGKGPAVPAAGDEVGVMDAAQAAFGAERHDDFFRELPLLPHAALHAAFAEVEGKVPGSVQASPVLPLELRIRVFRARNGDAAHLF